MAQSRDPQGRPVSSKKAATRGMDDGWTVTGTLITGIAFWGFVGWGLSKWTGWVGFFPIGVLLGAFAGVYLVYKQASAPPPLLDISKKQDGGLAARHARRLAEREKAEREAAQEADDTDSSGPERGDDEGHSDLPKQ